MANSNTKTVREIAVGMPDVTERLCYGTPGFYVKKKLFARMLEDGETVVLKIDREEREIRVRAEPEKFFFTDHYRKHPMMIVRLAAIERDELRELLNGAYQHARG